jgi:hypothetical protein
MRIRLGQALIVLACAGAAGGPASASSPACAPAWPEPFARGAPFLLNDPRSGLTLYVESDGRHMAAITRDGQILWHRDVFGDPKMQLQFVPPPPIEGWPEPSPKQLRQQARSFAAHLGIDRIESEPDCMLRFIDHDLPLAFHGHYIRAGSGTHIFWLLDAASGDIQMEQVN